MISLRGHRTLPGAYTSLRCVEELGKSSKLTHVVCGPSSVVQHARALACRVISGNAGSGYRIQCFGQFLTTDD